MKHRLRKRPEGRLQCMSCRAAFVNESSASKSVTPCEGIKLPHGHPYDREHVVHHIDYDRGTGHGPDRLCDEPSCICINHRCDCDVCRDAIDVPALKVLMDSDDEEHDMTANPIETRLPAQIRKYVVNKYAPEEMTNGAHDLISICKALNAGKSNNTVDVSLTMGALGALLEIARSWLDSDNGNDLMAAKSVLNRCELLYEPEDPRERRYEIKMPRSLAEALGPSKFSLPVKFDDLTMIEDYARIDWSGLRVIARIRPALLDWMLKKSDPWRRHGHPSERVIRAAKKFHEEYGTVSEQAQQAIAEYVERGQQPEPAPEPEMPFEESLKRSGFRGHYAHWARSSRKASDADAEAFAEWATELRMAQGDVKSPADRWVQWQVSLSQQPEKPKAEGPDWQHDELRATNKASSNNHKAKLLFGGKGGKGTKPTMEVPAGITYTGDGKYDIWDLETDEVLLTASLKSLIWWAPLTADYAQHDEDQDQPEEDEYAPPVPLIIVACGGAKADVESAPAEELYTGNYFRACMKAARVIATPETRILILSAKYGLVDPDQVIENYDMRLSDPEAVTYKTVQQQASELGVWHSKDVTVLGGSEYVELASRLWKVYVPVRGGIGEQLHQLAGIYGGEPEPDDTPAPLPEVHPLYPDLVRITDRSMVQLTF